MYGIIIVMLLNKATVEYFMVSVSAGLIARTSSIVRAYHKLFDYRHA